MRSPQSRAFAALTTTIALIAGCNPSTLTTSPTSPTGTGSPSAPSSAGSTIEPSATATSSGPHWEPAGVMTAARVNSQAVVLGDGRVLVLSHVSNEGAELWDPGTGTWQATATLNKPRGSFVLVALRDGRALVTGGLNDTEESYSSTYVFEPGTETWTKVGLLGTARTAPSAAVLPDGRVLVTGGYFHIKPTDARAPGPGIALAAYHPAEPSTPPLADVDPYPVGAAMATAELFDPATGTWSPTVTLTYARVGAAAVTLVDGRVLVVSSTTGPQGGVAVDPGAFDSAEIYDPETGRFSAAGELPAIDRAGLEAQGAPDANPIPDHDPTIEDIGTLVALPDGGAVLVGYAQYWKHAGEITRSFRFDADARRWTEIGQTYIVVAEPTIVNLTIPGARNLAGAMVAPLPDGGLLVVESDFGQTPGAAERYDPASDAWSALPSLPEPRSRCATVVLADGSVLLIGGFSLGPDAESLTSSIRFVP